MSLELTLQHRLEESAQYESATENERLYLTYMEGKRLGRAGEELCKQVRAEIDAKMSDGELVGYPDAFLTIQERTTYEIDQEKAMKVLSAAVWKRSAEISPKKLKALLEAGVVTQKEFDSIATPVVSGSLVPKTK